MTSEIPPKAQPLLTTRISPLNPVLCLAPATPPALETGAGGVVRNALHSSSELLFWTESFVSPNRGFFGSTSEPSLCQKEGKGSREIRKTDASPAMSC